MASYPRFAHVQTIPEIFRERVQLWTSYTWLLCGEITKLDIRLAWQLCLRGDGFIISHLCPTETQSKHSFGTFTAEGKKQGWARRIGVLLEVAVSSDRLAT